MSQNIPIYIPTYINNEQYAPVRVLPRLLFYNGMLECETYYIQSGSLTQSGISYAQNSFPYFDNYNVVTGSFPTTGSLSLLFNNEGAAYGTSPNESLYTQYWEKYISLLYNPYTRLFNCEGIIPLADYFKMELNDIVEWRGNYYHLRAINDYNLKNGECKIQLLGPILEDVITNLLPEKQCNFTFTSSVVVSPQAFTINFRRTGIQYIQTTYQTGSNGVSNAISMSVQNSSDGVNNWVDTDLSGPIGTVINTLNDGQRTMSDSVDATTIPTGSYWRLKQTNSDNSLQYSNVQFLTGSVNYQVYTCDTNLYGYSTLSNTSFGNLLQSAYQIWSSGTPGLPNTCFQIIKYLGTTTTGSLYIANTIPSGCNDASKCII